MRLDPGVVAFVEANTWLRTRCSLSARRRSIDMGQRDDRSQRMARPFQVHAVGNQSTLGELLGKLDYGVLVEILSQ